MTRGLSATTATRAILTGRVVLGTMGVAAPWATMRLLQMEPQTDRTSGLLMRMFGARDVFLAAAALLAAEPGRGRILVAAGVVDLSDATAAIVAGCAGQIPRRASAIAASAALVGALLSAATAGRGPLVGTVGRPGPTPRP